MLTAMFSGYALWFTIPALIATGAFVIKLSLLLTGADAIDDHADFSAAAGDGHAGTDDGAGAFKLLSVQAMMGFLMGFGWGGFAALQGSGFGLLASIGIGVGCGLGMMWLLAFVFRAMSELESSGNIGIHQVIGKDGVVDVTVPSARSGMGRVRVIVDERQRSYSAMTEGAELGRATRVRILSAEGDNTLMVASI